MPDSDLIGPLAEQLPRLKPDDQAALTREYLTKKLPQWGKLKADERDSLVKDVVGKYGKGLDPSAGSVFSRPQTTGEQLKSAGKTAAELGVGVGIPTVAGAMLGPEAGVAAKISTQALAGAVQPFAEAGVAKLMGDDPKMPGVKDALKSAAFNAGLTSVGEGIGALGGKAAAVRPEIEAFPGPQSRATVNQALKNRDFYRQMGLNENQIDEVIKSPNAQAQLAKQIAAGQETKQAFQTVIDHTRDMFHNRYAGVLGEQASKPIDTGELSQAFQAASQGAGEHELTPTFRKFLERKGNELGGEAASGPSVGGVPWAQLSPKLKAQMQAQGMVKGPTVLTVEDAQKLRTELRENIPSNPTPLDQKAAKMLNAQITEQIERPLSPEQRAGMQALDQEYGRFSQMLHTLDPRSEQYGSSVADALFDPMVKNPGDALTFVNYAKAAEKARPGEVMPQLRSAFANKVLNESRTPGAPFEELRALRKLQDTWGSDKNARAVMGAVFGKDSPLADPATFAKTLGYADNPRSVIDAVGSKPGRFRTVLSSPYMQAYAMSAVLTTASGIKGGGLWTSMMGEKGPEAQLMAITAMLVGPAVIGKVVGSGNVALQRSMVNFMTKPEPANMVRYMGELSGATAGGLVSLPSTEQSSPAQTAE